MIEVPDQTVKPGLLEVPGQTTTSASRANPNTVATRMALGLAYDGNPWYGWQTQPRQRGVQDQLEAALSRFLGQPINTVCAGRTDTGVHACAQVVHFDSPATRPAHAWVRALNSFLPDSIAIQWAQPVAVAFHARYAALGRRYTYYLLNHPVAQPLLQGRVGRCPRALDDHPMKLAAQHLIGTHDFSAFRSSECQANSPVRTLRELTIERRGAVVRFTVEGNAFLHHMVRNIVGALVYVGLHKIDPLQISVLLSQRDRRAAPPTFAPGGLYFEGPSYALDWGLPTDKAAIPLFGF